MVAVVDTNCNPDDIDYVIPANDDAIRAVKLVCSKIADAVIKGRTSEAMTPTEEEAGEGLEEAELVPDTEPVVFTPDDEERK